MADAKPKATVTDLALYKARGPRDPKAARLCGCAACVRRRVIEHGSREVFFPPNNPPPTKQEPQTDND